MAKYDVSHSCGHQVVHSLFGPGRDRERRIEWLEGQPCTDCWREQQQSAATATTQELALPALAGTEKQVAWGERIRAGFLRGYLEDVHRCVVLAGDVIYGISRGDTFLLWAQDRGLELGSMVVISPSGESRNIREEVVDAMRHLLIDWAAEREGASWWIENRDDLYLRVKDECHERLAAILREIVDGEDAIAAIEQERRAHEIEQEAKRAEATESARLQREAEAEATIRPENERSPLAVTLSLAGKRVRVAYPEKDEGLRTLLRARGFSWAETAWVRDAHDEEAAAHLLVEIGVKALAQRLPIACIDEKMRARIVANDYAEEPPGKIAIFVKGTEKGMFAISWDRERGDYYDAAKRLRGARWNASAKQMAVPAAAFEMVMDFAERNGFRIAPSAAQLAQRECDKRASEMVVPPPAISPDAPVPAMGDAPAPLAVPEAVEIPDSLKDEAKCAP